MFRTLTSLAFAAILALAGLAATAAPSAAGHRDRVHFGVGIGFGSGYVHVGNWRHRHYHPRYRFHPRFGVHGRYYNRYRGYYYNPYRYRYGSVYRRHRAPVIYHQPRVRYRSGGAHIEWCYARYRSYRAYDNTFQPYHGPRRQCWSPYS